MYTQHEENYITAAKAMNIQFDDELWCNDGDMHIIDAVDEWRGLLQRARELGIDWSIGNYAPDDLQLTIDTVEDNRESTLEDEARSVYYATRGI